MKINGFNLLKGFGITFICLFGITNEIYSQDKFDSLIKKHFYAGLGVGPETGISGFLPKISYYNFKERKSIESYYGIEGSVWVIGAGMFSADLLYGIKKNSFTLDNSIGLWWYPKTEENNSKNGPYFHVTLNPKLGIKFWKLWVKTGPSIFIFRDYPKSEERIKLLDITKIGNVYYNFEILIKL
jgi:hypothetical protein